MAIHVSGPLFPGILEDWWTDLPEPPKGTLYSCPAVRQRLVEFLGGDSLDHSTALFVTHSDGCGFDFREVRPSAELDWFLDRNLDVARSLADTTSLLLHLDVEYVNFDRPVEAFVDPWRTFDLQEPVVRVIESLLLGWGIRPLHIVTGQGHHFVWRIDKDSQLAHRIALLSPSSELVDACQDRVPPLLRGCVDREAQKAFSALSLIFQFVAQQVKELAAPLCEVPVEITAVHVGPGTTARREIISIDISEYGDPLQTRVIRAPFTNYLKPWVTGLAKSQGVAGEVPLFPAIPLHEMDIRQAIVLRQVESEVRELARRACVRIPEESEGTARMVDSYLASRLRRFHEFFYSEQHDPRERWPVTYGRTALEGFPFCVQDMVTFPNDRLLKPAGIQLLTRCLLASGWHPRHIAGLIRSKFEDEVFNWGTNWRVYEPGTRADFYTAIFSGLYVIGVDKLIDFNCTSTQEKGFCVINPTGCPGLEQPRSALLSQQPS